MSTKDKKKADSVTAEPTHENQANQCDEKQGAMIVPNSDVEIKQQVEVERLSDEEKVTLKECETEIHNGVQAVYAIGKALRTVRDQRLYREDYKTFDEYLQKITKVSRSYAYDLMRYDEVRENLSAVADIDAMPLNERQTRPLAGLDPETQREVWKVAVEKADKEPVTGSLVKRAADELLGRVPDKSNKSSASIIHSGMSGNPFAASDWVSKRVNAMLGENYLADFTQPLSWDDETADVYAVAENVYLKFIDKVEVASALYAIALRAQSPNGYCIVNGESNQCADPQVSGSGEITGLFCPHLDYFARQAQIFIEYKGQLFEIADQDNNTNIVWKPVTDVILNEIFTGYSNKLETGEEKLAA